MRALFVGLGSIGCRHLRNLRALCKARELPLEVVALRSSARALAKDVAELVDVQQAALLPSDAFELAFITNPTHLHAPLLQQLKGRVGCFFIEKPIFEKTDYTLDELGLGAAQKAYVAAPMRWCGVYRALAAQLADFPVYSVRAICSSYLPSWRPESDYRSVYSARREMGGGVALDLIHEWDYLISLFGLPEKSVMMQGKFSRLEIDSDDLALYIAQYPGFLCELHLDYFGREYRRTMEVFSHKGSLMADFGAGTLRLPDGSSVDCTEPPGRRYEREMDYFLSYAVEGKGESINSPRRALQVLAVALGEKFMVEGSGENE